VTRPRDLGIFALLNQIAGLRPDDRIGRRLVIESIRRTERRFRGALGRAARAAATRARALRDLVDELPARRHVLCEAGARQCDDCGANRRYFTAARGGLTREQWQQQLAEERAAAEAHAIQAAAALAAH
jgi:hypothetical protein